MRCPSFKVLLLLSLILLLCPALYFFASVCDLTSTASSIFVRHRYLASTEPFYFLLGHNYLSGFRSLLPVNQCASMFAWLAHTFHARTKEGCECFEDFAEPHPDIGVQWLSVLGRSTRSSQPESATCRNHCIRAASLDSLGPETSSGLPVREMMKINGFQSVGANTLQEQYKTKKSSDFTEQSESNRLLKWAGTTCSTALGDLIYLLAGHFKSTSTCPRPHSAQLEISPNTKHSMTLSRPDFLGSCEVHYAASSFIQAEKCSVPSTDTDTDSVQYFNAITDQLPNLSSPDKDPSYPEPLTQPAGDADKIASNRSHNSHPTFSHNNRFNYASNNCGARVLSANSEAIDPAAVIHPSKDWCMLNPCSSKHKWIVIELCDRMAIDQIRIGNFEYFSSMVQHVQIEASNRYPTTNWTKLGDFVVPNVRTFHNLNLNTKQLEHPKWFKYVRILFLSHYGQQFYCSVTEIQVYGLPLSEKLQAQLQMSSFQHHLTNLPERATQESKDLQVTPNATKLDEFIDWESYLSHQSLHSSNSPKGTKSPPSGAHFSTDSDDNNPVNATTAPPPDASPTSGSNVPNQTKHEFFPFIESDDDFQELFHDDSEDNFGHSKSNHQFLQTIKLIQSVAIHLRHLQLEHSLLVDYLNHTSSVLKENLHTTIFPGLEATRDDLSNAWAQISQLRQENYDSISQLRSELKWYLYSVLVALSLVCVLFTACTLYLTKRYFREVGRARQECGSFVARQAYLYEKKNVKSDSASIAIASARKKKKK